LPAIRVGRILAAVPHMGYQEPQDDTQMTLLFSPSKPVAGGVFEPLA
jgi:hypothetical protein